MYVRIIILFYRWSISTMLYVSSLSRVFVDAGYIQVGNANALINCDRPAVHVFQPVPSKSCLAEFVADGGID